jgi:hypothetical protein
MRSRNTWFVLAFVTAIAACEAEPQPQPDGPSHDKNTQIRPTHCLYGDPQMEMHPEAVIVTCPDGGVGPTVVCPGGFPSGAKLEDGRVVVECATNDAVQPQNPSLENPR